MASRIPKGMRSEWGYNMSRIEITQRELSLRGKQIRKFLVPLAKAPGGPAWQTRTPVGSFIIGAHDGSPSASDYRDWRFSTITPGYRAMYFELWIKQDPKWYLDRAYLSIFRIEQGSRDETELLCLHCDPNEPPGEHTPYKIGPSSSYGTCGAPNSSCSHCPQQMPFG